MTATRRIRAAALLTVAALVAPAAARAWGATGHRVVAHVAEQHLSDRARSGVRALLGTRSLARVANWPDFIRAEPAWDFAGVWHYVTLEDEGSLDAVRERANASVLPDNVIEAIEFSTAVLRGDAGRIAALRDLLSDQGAEPYAGSIEATALVFLVHLVGDVHQPLHVGRGDDRGGNQITVNWFDGQENLHSLWDSGLIDHQGLSYTELAAFLEQDLAAEGESWGGGSAADWALESYRLRRGVYTLWGRVDRDNHLPELGWAYSHDHIGTVERRLYQGGLRLAALLDSIFE
jgi:hypothetical protein